MNQTARFSRGLAVLTLLTGTLLLSACGGWHLRGTGPNQLPFTRVFIVSEGGGYLYPWFVTQLGYSGISVIKDRAKAEAVIELRRERFDRRVLSVDDQTGKVREMEVGLEVELTVRTPGGTVLAAPEILTWTQDFVFDEAALLGTEEVETTIRYGLAKDAARALIFRLEALDLDLDPERARKNAG